MEYATGQQLTRRQSTVWRALRAAAPQTIPVLAGYFVLGMGYGIYVQSLGLPVWMPMLMGTVVYGGSLEFVLASLLLSAFSPLSAFLMALMIQARHLFYGLAMLERYKGYGLRSFYMIFAMSDETFSITCSAEPPEGVDRGWFMFFITLLDQCYWVFSAGLGAVVGSVLPFSTEGVDFVMTAMFTVIFLNQWEKDRQHYSALIGLAAPLVCLAVFGSGSFLLPSMGCILVLLLALRKPIEKAEGTEAEKSGEEELFHLCGSLCTVNDVLARDVALHDPQKGDVICFKRCGAYAATEGMAMFLSRELPQVLICKTDGKIEKLRDQMETYLFHVSATT